MASQPDFEKLNVSDLADFCRIVDAIRDPANPATTLKGVELRLKAEERAGRGRKIVNVSDRLAKISVKLYGKPGLLIASSPGSGNVRVLDEGRRLHHFATIILRTLKRFRTDTAQDIDRTLTIHSASAFAAHILPVLLREYLKHSYFRYIWVYEHTQVIDILRAVSNGDADIGICIDWPDHSLNKTELARAARGIIAGQDYLQGRNLLQRELLAEEAVITYQPNTLQRIKIDDVFPEPSENGVRIYAETENVIYGWINNNAAIGHGYLHGIQRPDATKLILSELMRGKPEVCWCAYTLFHITENLGEREKQIAAVINAMRIAAQNHFQNP